VPRPRALFFALSGADVGAMAGAGRSVSARRCRAAEWIGTGDEAAGHVAVEGGFWQGASASRHEPGK